MDFWLAIVLIVAMSMLSGVIIEALKTKRVVAKHGGREMEADELKQLRERVQVLERAITDPSRRLASEIDRLRELEG